LDKESFRRKVFSKIELFVTRNLYQKPSFFFTLVAYPLSLLYKFLTLARNHFYSRAKKIRSKIPVICVGNIEAGGTGKSPLVKKLIADLKESFDIGVVSTGYKSVGASRNHVISPIDKRGDFIDSCFCGDEPLMIQKMFRSIKVFVCKNRTISINKAEKLGCDLLIFDDGFQDKKIHKDFIFLMLDYKQDLKKGRFLPYGTFRDDPRELRDADVICLKLPFYEHESQICLDQIKKFSNAPILVFKDRPLSLKGDKEYALEELKNMKVALFSAIARPERFFQTIQSLGAETLILKSLPDHHPITSDFLQRFVNDAKEKGASVIVCTQKDYVKVSKNFSLIPICYLDLDVELVSEKQEYFKIIQKVKNLGKK
jgi:tetraacyldisaccharide 4'-kinase